ncbi:MAG: hypothetical protein V7725_00145 [Porticoccus sp.]
MLPFTVNAENFCLLLAENYYEQLYCEVKAMGRGHRLPSLLDFRRNNELTQAMLLKRPAAKVGIEVVLPKREAAPSRETSPKITQSKTMRINREMDSGGGLRQCLFNAKSIQCADDSYHLVGNEANSKLVKGVLADSNRMDIPIYSGLLSDQQALNQYLTRAYRQYVEKMLEIGLGGSTFSYVKFVFLFNDVTAKGIDFSQRFETMFRFLKQDKQNIAVSEALPSGVPLAREYCDRLDDSLVVCDGGRKNYLYRHIN